MRTQDTKSTIAKSLAAVSLLVALVACSHDNRSTPPQDNSQPDISIPAVANKIRFDSAVTSDRVSAVNESISLLSVVPLSLTNTGVASMAKMMGIKDVQAQTLQNWMQDRVQYVVNDGFDFETNLVAVKTTAPFVYSNPTAVPDSLKGANLPTLQTTADASGAQVVMLNIGALAYYVGKVNHQLAGVNLGGIGLVSMTSPRVGLLEIGPGLFPDLKGHKVQNILLGIMRTGTLFHEARHSDGHGTTLGFLHTVCPPGSDYEGMNACDAATNGPYTIGALMTKTLMQACTSCTDLTKQVLEEIYLDIADRVLTPDTAPTDLAPDAPAGVDWNDAPEGHR